VTMENQDSSTRLSEQKQRAYLDRKFTFPIILLTSIVGTFLLFVGLSWLPQACTFWGH
jgi:hypothetical protein